MRLTCKELKFMIGTKNGEIYKGHNAMTGKPETRIDMIGLTGKQRIKIKKWLSDRGIFLYQDDPVHLPCNYVATY